MTKPLDLSKINDSETLLDLLISCEAVLDGSDAYVGENWIEGEVIEGPIVSRYWVKIGLLYPYDKMPDPRVALRLLRIGVQVEYDRMQRAVPAHIPGQERAKKPDEWLVQLTFPRRLLDQNEKTDLEMYDDEIVADDIEKAEDTGLDSESSLYADEQVPDMNQEPPETEQPDDQGKPPA